MPENPQQYRPTRYAEVTQALTRHMSLFAGVAVFSGVINLLTLTGALYMLQVYDRVIPSRSIATLVGLTVLMVGLYFANGVFDVLRSRIMNRIGLKLDRDLRDKVFDVVMLMPLRFRPGGDGLLPIRDLDQIRGFLATPGPAALFDLPWMPVFLVIIYILHPALGILATAGALVLLILAVLTEFRSRDPVRATVDSGGARQVFAEAARRNAEVARAMGMGRRLQAIWIDHTRRHLMDQRKASDVVGGFGGVTKILRMILQSAMLGAGAYLVIGGEATAGVMIAGSILLSRALAPIEVAIANWRGLVAARQSYERLKMLFGRLPRVQDPMVLPAPSQSLAVQGLWVAAPGGDRAIVQNISFQLEAGAGLGIIGPSASGKSSLARALVGVWQPLPQRGSVRLDGAALDQWSPEQLGPHIGYLPQNFELFDGSVAHNIGRFDPAMTAEAVVAAAQSAGVHEMILELPQGYGTRIGEGGLAISAGQRQRIGLARALYGDPFLVVLDEPNSNLDAHGDKALEMAIRSVRERAGIVIVIAHRPSALSGLDVLLAMGMGRMAAYGPKEKVLQHIKAKPGAPGQQQHGPQPLPSTLGQPRPNRPPAAAAGFPLTVIPPADGGGGAQ